MSKDADRKAIFAERLKQAAVAHYGREHGIVTRLADDVGVSFQATSKWLKGDVMPRPEMWGVIAAKLGVTAAWLVGDTHETPAQLADIPDEALELASQAAKIVFPLIDRLQPGADQATRDELFRHAYQELKAGKPSRSVAGDVAARLM
jgi:transcriptional regulator with XRE-family HTH domain